MGSLPAFSYRSVKSTCQLASRLVLSYANEGFAVFIACFCTTPKDEENGVKSKRIELPPEPQNCCMSGCANCVWIAYAEEVAKVLNDGGESAKKKILQNVKDPNLRAFLMLELQHLFKKGK